MAAPWCIHDLSPAGCSVCAGRDGSPVAEHDPARFGPWFEARYRGDCAGCGIPIRHGEMIRASGAGGYLCGPCGSEPRTPGGR